MRVLLVHPEDSPELAPWSEASWDLIVDLGWSGTYAYAELSRRLRCEVISLYGLLDHAVHRDRLRELNSVGLGQIVDSEGIDWWEVYSANLDHTLSQLLMIAALADRIPVNADVFTTRAHPASRTLSILLKREIKVFSNNSPHGPTQGLAKKLRTLRPSQILEIAGDKWDTDYQLRRLWTRRHRASTESLVLFPSAYQNVSRIQIAYARMLPERRFILVVTRRNGRIDVPANVEVRSLAAYAPTVAASTELERSDLLRRWESLKLARLYSHALLLVGLQEGAFVPFEKLLRDGLRIRDAWNIVFANEPVAAVLSGDENNEFTRLPSILARSRRIRTLACDHGALNLTLALRTPCAEIYLAAGEMARDYMVNWCGLEADRVTVGAPDTNQGSNPPLTQQAKDWIVFFSTPQEIAGGRTQVLYSEILPELCGLAARTKRKVIVKLHPFESRAARGALIENLLGAPDRALIELRDGPIKSELLERAWFTITVNSSVAVASTMAQVPCFLCDWFDGGWYDYGKQFAKFSAAYPLDSPEQIREIPERLSRIRITDATRNQLHSPVNAARLDSLLFGDQ